MNVLSVFDPQTNEIFFNAKSIGLAIVNSELSTEVHNLIKRALKNPTVILEQSNCKRNYVFLTKNLDIHTVNVVFQDKSLSWLISRIMVFSICPPKSKQVKEMLDKTFQQFCISVFYTLKNLLRVQPFFQSYQLLVLLLKDQRRSFFLQSIS